MRLGLWSLTEGFQDKEQVQTPERDFCKGCPEPYLTWRLALLRFGLTLSKNIGKI